MYKEKAEHLEKCIVTKHLGQMSAVAAGNIISCRLQGPLKNYMLIFELWGLFCNCRLKTRVSKSRIRAWLKLFSKVYVRLVQIRVWEMCGDASDLPLFGSVCCFRLSGHLESPCGKSPHEDRRLTQGWKTARFTTT